jgi:hypothetical protein
VRLSLFQPVLSSVIWLRTTGGSELVQQLRHAGAQRSQTAAVALAPDQTQRSTSRGRDTTPFAGRATEYGSEALAGSAEAASVTVELASQPPPDRPLTTSRTGSLLQSLPLRNAARQRGSVVP